MRKRKKDEKPAATPTGDQTQVDLVEEKPRLARMVPLALQHVLIAYAGLITTPLVVGIAIGLSNEELAVLIAANLVVAGIATMIQTLGIWRFGVRYPIVMGSTFTAIGPSIVIGDTYGLPALFGGTLIAGLLTIVVAPWFGKLLKYFPPVVTGSVIAIIGISLLPTSASLIQGEEGTPGYNTPSSFLLAALTVAIVLAVDRFGRGTMKQVSILAALVIGTVLAVLMGKVSFAEVGQHGVLSIPRPFSYGAPEFILAAILPLLVVQFVNMVEATGDTLAIGEIVGRKTGAKEVSRALSADGLGTAIGSVFAPFSLVSFANNVGLVQITRMHSRFVVAVAGLFLVIIGLIAPLGDIAATLPEPVMGGITVVMFGTIGAVGIKILGQADLSSSRNIFVVAVAFAFGMIPVGAPDFWIAMPELLQPVLSSSIAAGGVAAFVINLLLNVWGVKDKPEDGSAAAEEAESGRNPAVEGEANA